VSVLRSAAVLGIQSGATVARLAGADDGEPYVAGMLAGGLVGTLAGDRWAAPRGVGTGEGLLVNAGHLAGSATALGVTYLVVDRIEENETALLLASTLGGFLGAGLVWRAVAFDHPRRPDRAARERPDTGVRAEIHALGILQGLWGSGSGLEPDRAPGSYRGAPPAVSPWITIRF
jgi:hypothetical protein